MNRLAICATLLLAACDALPTTGQQPAKTVQVMGRQWAVTQIGADPATWKAVRDNNGLDPFGRPAATRTAQGIRAIEAATGCRVVRASMYQTDTGAFVSQVACN